jgi:DNA-binding transcriptional regulator YbjK
VTPRQAAKTRTRAKIIEAAKSSFETIGYEASTVRLIADSIGMSTGAVFGNFKDKSALYAEINSHPPITPERGAQLLARLQTVTDTLAYLKGEDWQTIKGSRELIAATKAARP